MSILKAFTGHLMEFAKEIKRVFPEDADLRTGYIFLEGLVKINPKSVLEGSGAPWRHLGPRSQDVSEKFCSWVHMWPPLWDPKWAKIAW